MNATLLELRRNPGKIVEAIERAVSVVTTLELFQGARNKQGITSLRRFLNGFDSRPLTPDVGYRAVVYMEQHALRWTTGFGCARETRSTFGRSQ